MIGKNGIVSVDTSKKHYLINNFSESGNITGWTFGTNTFSSGVVTLTGTAPNIKSPTFSVGADDIVVVEFTISLPTVSTTTSGPGLYLGTLYGQSVYCHSYNFTTNQWTKSTSLNTNPYFIYSYNSTVANKVKTYVLGANVNLEDVPKPERTNASYSINCIQLANNDSTNLRSGYNSNTSMVIKLSDVRVYKIDEIGIRENSDKRIGKGYLSFNNYIEI